MAARKNRGSAPGSMSENWREKIKAGQLAHRLYAHVEGEIELSQTQIKAIDMLFKRIEPELARMEHTGEGGGAIKHEATVKFVD